MQQTESPFTTEVLNFPLPVKFRMPQIEAFDGTKDPVDHLNIYKNQMDLNGYQDPIRCMSRPPDLDSTRLADPNRSPGRETIYILYCTTGTLIDLFFLRAVLVLVVYK